MEQIKVALEAIVGETGVFCAEPMKKHTTFQTGGNADYFVMPETAQQVQQVIQYVNQQNIPFYIIGNGSNLLVSDEGIRGVVIQIGTRMQTISIQQDTMHIQAGALLSRIAAEAAKENLDGFVFASGIPGTFGGAVVMNAGAYGGELKDVLVSVEVLTKELEIKTIPAEQLSLSYRYSIIPEQQYVVLGGTIKLTKGNCDDIQYRMAELAKQRREKQPLQYASGGSTFKRPEGYFAGKLISDAGLKGYTVGGAKVSEKHAGFVINTGTATTNDILAVMAHCQKTVFEKFGVWLEPELKYLGNITYCKKPQ